MSMLRSMKQALRGKRNLTLEQVIASNDVFGNATLSGVNMTTDKALQLSPYWEAIDIISGDIAKLPFNTFKRIPGTDNGRELAVNAPAFRLLRRSPNPNMTPFVFIKAMAADAVQGNAFAFIAKDRSGTPAELIKLDRHSTTAFKVNGKIEYVTTTSTGRKVFMDEDEVIHIKGMSPDGIMGYDLLDKAKQTTGIAFSAQAYGAKFFANDASGHVVIEVPGKMSPEAKKNLKDSWERMHQGMDNFHKTAVLENGAKITQMAINAKDAQLLETREFSIGDIAGFFRMPPHKLGDDAKVSFSSLESENQSYLDTCLDPWLVSFEQEFIKKLLTPVQRASGSLFIEANRNVLLRVDSSTKWDTYVKAISNGIMSRNEVRARENLNPVDGLDEYTIQVNMQPIATDDPDNPISTNQPQPNLDTGLIDDETTITEDQRAMIEATFSRILKRWVSMRDKNASSSKFKTVEQAREALIEQVTEAQKSTQSELEPYCRSCGLDPNTVSESLNTNFNKHLHNTCVDDIIGLTIQETIKEVTHGT